MGPGGAVVLVYGFPRVNMGLLGPLGDQSQFTHLLIFLHIHYPKTSAPE
jgi:hypothetical protein